MQPSRLAGRPSSLALASERYNIYHLKAVQDVGGEVIQDSVPVV